MCLEPEKQVDSYLNKAKIQQLTMLIMPSPGSGEGIAFYFNETEDENLPTKKMEF